MSHPLFWGIPWGTRSNYFEGSIMYTERVKKDFISYPDAVLLEGNNAIVSGIMPCAL
jgi:hypothetical protein